MIRLKDLDHNIFYLFGLVVLVIGLPWSPFLISLSQAILLTNWILEGDLIFKFKMLLKRKGALLFISIFLFHILGTLYSTDVPMAFKDIKIKLPLFIFPLVMATTKTLSLKQLKIILYAFLVAFFISSLLSVLALLGLTNHEINDIRDISLFISHIRFALLINIGIFSASFLLFIANSRTCLKSIILWVFLIWFTAFLFILQSLTGIIVFIITTGFLLIRWSFLRKNKFYKYAGLIIAILIPLVIVAYITVSVKKYYTIDKVNIEKLDTHTKAGNKYLHKPGSKAIENGHFVWLYVCYPELEQEWNKRSKIKYHETDKKGHQIKLTLIRFLTSKGYRKDAEGIARLSNEEIEYIENGIANYIFINKFGFYPRIYQSIWEIEQYKNGKNPSGHSLTQRIEYYKSAYGIFRQNVLFGVGTGDVKAAFDEYYKDSNSRLKKKWRLRAHNQFMTFLVTFGIVGLFWIVFSFTMSIYREQGFKNYLFTFFFFIAFLSMINEDTLETQAGATFFAYFYCLFLFAYKSNGQFDFFKEINNKKDIPKNELHI
ncbi:O-antigen ligase family protein [Bacteroidota bacterium]